VSAALHRATPGNVVARPTSSRTTGSRTEVGWRADLPLAGSTAWRHAAAERSDEMIVGPAVEAPGPMVVHGLKGAQDADGVIHGRQATTCRRSLIFPGTASVGPSSPLRHGGLSSRSDAKESMGRRAVLGPARLRRGGTAVPAPCRALRARGHAA
jgi:hypothetical protein